MPIKGVRRQLASGAGHGRALALHPLTVLCVIGAVTPEGGVVEWSGGTVRTSGSNAAPHSGQRTDQEAHMSTHTAQTGSATHTRPATTRRISTETKASFKTTEFFAYVAAVVGVLAASAIVDATDFGSQDAWFFVTLLTIGYMISRGLAKSGSRDFYDDDRDAAHSHR